jgi:hypothetical protein
MGLITVDQEKRALTATVFVMFAASCPFSAFWGRGGFLEGGTDFPGWQLLLIGWLPLFGFSIPWCANIVAAASILRLRQGRHRDALGMALTAVVFASTPMVMLPSGSDRFELRTGYFLWLSSFITWAAGLIHLRHRARRTKPLAKKFVLDEL